MIALLTGNIVFKSIDHIILETGGVGYRVMIPLSTFYSLPEQGDSRLHIYTHVKEDAIHLYGFLGLDEKEMFQLLLSVSGIGPRLALNILSNITTEELKSSLYDGNLKRLSGIPGIGKKTAERMVLELKDKVAKMQSTGRPATTRLAAASTLNVFDDTLSALTNLGYKETQARKALESMEIPAEASLEDILKGALKVLLK